MKHTRHTRPLSVHGSFPQVDVLSNPYFGDLGVRHVKSFILSMCLFLHGQGEKVSSRNLQSEITEPRCRREGEATIYTQKGPRHDTTFHRRCGRLT